MTDDKLKCVTCGGNVRVVRPEKGPSYYEPMDDSELKIWIIDFPYDYHKQGQILVKARTREDARQIVEQGGEDVLGILNVFEDAIKWDTIREWEGPVYLNSGCDC